MKIIYNETSKKITLTRVIFDSDIDIKKNYINNTVKFESLIFKKVDKKMIPIIERVISNIRLMIYFEPYCISLLKQVRL